MTFNTQQVQATLKAVLPVLDNCQAEYRLFGSIIPAAVKGNLHRELGDLNFLLEFEKKDYVFEKLKQLGYQKKKKNYWRYSEWIDYFIFVHEELLEVGFFTVKFDKREAILNAAIFNITIRNDAIYKTQYKFQDIEFCGIPQDTAFTGVSLSKDNPKRIREIEIFKNFNVKQRKNDYINVSLGKLKVDWLMDLLNITLNVIGKVRLKLGKTYDFWR